ncbi:MAG: mechanosensitive ion channel family protein [Actinomycetes bacterium]
MTPLLTFSFPETPLTLGAIVLAALVLKVVLNRAIRLGVQTSLKAAERHRQQDSARAAKVLGPLGAVATARHEARTRTTGSFLKNVVSVLLVVLVVLTSLDALGVPLAPLLASAGIGGIALAFGAQSLVKDYISGMFLILEDQFGVGDFIDTGEVKGTVEEVGLRVTRLRDPGGQIWYVRNGEILRVGNLSQGHSTGVVDVPIAWNENATRALAVLESVVDEVFADEKWADVLLERPTVAGVNEVAGGAATLRIFAKCAPDKHWGVERYLRERAVAALQAAGIRGPAVPVGQAPPAG